VVEVFARDEIGLLATVARVFADLGFDVTVAKVATTGELAVDAFYVQDQGSKITTAARAGELERTLRAAVQRG
jgi:UTP:GlnB (protein PII) uridylyltransferase